MHPCAFFLLVAAAVSQVCDDECSRILGSVNQERAKVGKPAMCVNSALMRAAQNQAEHQNRIKTMTHTGSGGSSIGERVTAAGYKWTMVAENVAFGQSSAHGVMLGWMNSPGHKKNILSDNTEMGIAHVGDYWAQAFGTPRQGAGGCDTATVGGQLGTVEPTKLDIGPRCTGMCQTLLGVVNSNRQSTGLLPVCISPKLMTAAAKVVSTRDTANFRDFVEETGFGANAVGLATQSIRSSAGPPTDQDLTSMFRQNYRGSSSDKLYTRAGIASDARRENWYVVFAATFTPELDQCEGFAAALPPAPAAPSAGGSCSRFQTACECSGACGWTNGRCVLGGTTDCTECPTKSGCGRPLAPPAAQQCSQITSPCQCVGTCGWSTTSQACAATSTGAITDCYECPTLSSCLTSGKGRGA